MYGLWKTDNDLWLKLLSVASGQWLSYFILSRFVSFDQFEFSHLSRQQFNEIEMNTPTKNERKKDKSEANDEQERNNIKIDEEIRFESTYARICVHIYMYNKGIHNI